MTVRPAGGSSGGIDLASAEATQGVTLFTGDDMRRIVSRTRVGVDLVTALRRPASPEDILLFDNDSLHIPLHRTTVEITGAVNVPSIIAADRMRSINFYVRAAGGASVAGNARRAYVIQPNGKIEAKRRLLGVVPINPRPMPGATVVVPVQSSNDVQVQRLAATIQIVVQTLGSLATVWAILR